MLWCMHGTATPLSAGSRIQEIHRPQALTVCSPKLSITPKSKHGPFCAVTTINIFDTEYKHLGDQLSEVPPDDQLSSLCDLDYHAIGLLYSARLPFKYAPVHPQLLCK